MGLTNNKKSSTSGEVVKWMLALILMVVMVFGAIMFISNKVTYAKSFDCELAKKGCGMQGADAQDSDNDGIPDDCDICPNANDLKDWDGDCLPDACDENPHSTDKEVKKIVYAKECKDGLWEEGSGNKAIPAKGQCLYEADGSTLA